MCASVVAQALRLDMLVGWLFGVCVCVLTPTDAKTTAARCVSRIQVERVSELMLESVLV